MKLTVRCTYQSKEAVFEVPVGDGRKTFKWLGVAAAQRFGSHAKPAGCRRHRERLNCGVPSASARLLPARVSTASNPFCHPYALLCDELEDQDEVLVLLTDKFVVDAVGKPCKDRWMRVAFGVSDNMKDDRDMAMLEEKKVIDKVQKALEAEHNIKAAAVIHRKALEMKEFVKDQLYSRDKVLAAFEEDWVKINNPVYQPLDKLVGGQEDQSRIRELMLDCYLSISELFKYYSCYVAGLRTADMEFVEFSTFIHDSKILNMSKNRELVERVFQESANNGTFKATSTGVANMSIKLHEFFFALIKVALLRYQLLGAGDIRGFRTTTEGNRVAENPADAVKWLLEEYITPLVERKLIGLQVKRALERDEVLALLFDHHDQMRKVFDAYSTKVIDESSSLYHEQLNIKEFGLILEHAHLLGGHTRGDDELTTKEARQAFSGAQNALCGESEEQVAGLKKASSEGSSAEQMTYAEFLEAVARVAVLKWDDPATPIFSKILWALESVGKLANETA